MADRNGEVARLLENIADLLEVKGESTFRIRAYREAARQIGILGKNVDEVRKQGKLEEVPGVGPSIAAKIAEYLEKGRSAYLDELQQEIPPSVADLLQVPGLGPRTAQLIYAHLGVGSVAELVAAAREHRLRTVPGIGPKTEEKLLRETERLQQRTSRMLLAVALPAADEVAALLRENSAVERVEPAGSIRRRLETIGDIDLVASSSRPHEVMKAFTSLPLVKEIIATGPTKSSVLAFENLQIDLRVVDPSVFGAALQHFTGSRAHNIHVRDLAISEGFKLNEYGLFSQKTDELVASGTEEEIYHALGMACPPPELREDRGEVEAALEHDLPELVRESDLRGDLHVHTDWSDGLAPVEAMVKAAIARGYEYVAITDHSQSLGVAHGLSPDRVREQRRLVDQLNRQYQPFRILQGIEIEIRGNGSLDYDDETLRYFDIVTASLHSGRGQSREKVTGRVLSALGSGFVDVLNHPSGRIISRRAAYEVDLARTIEEAAALGIALEINSSPDRLDLDDVWARRAKEAGVLLAINSDAHAPDQLSFVRWGTFVARRAWLRRRDVLNTLPLEALPRRLSRLRRAA
ncbi:MAG: DNA polymerase/3'-5' exonuclease PolX [Chloroflexi bacterium]|nr:DNA polymerase/3'-5' exonuclease PolX [Chloroflexota bacterium]MCL5108134.1 DNA polymerase/3'-5' exonuclease PolX [Chloroflexota bacterium]